VGHPDAPPITSFQLRYPLQIHAELMTHRVFSRNARSSRAVPTARMLEEVRTAPFIPRYWGRNQKGMQAGEEHNALLEGSGNEPDVTRDEAWLEARDDAVRHAERYMRAGYHKQICNRLLAPFLHIDVVLTTTNLSNWDALRDDPAAEPHIRDLAVAMKEALIEPTQLERGEWHLPYISDDERGPDPSGFDWAVLRACSVTRCAQVSYVPFHEARLTIAEEVARHDALIAARPMHASPCEHQATPDTKLPDGSWAHPELAGNLGPGWIQYRKTLPGERA
jgi:hypothetical protein